MAFLKLQDIGKIYMSADNASVGIRKVNLSFEKGEFVAVTGKSGSGKTTLLNVIGGLDSFEEGELYIEGRSTSHYAKADWDEYVSKYISFIFQDYNILESFTVLENIEFALTSIKDLKERKQRALDIAKKVGLEGRLKTKGVKLSGGEKQRTVIARAIAKDSPIILADEPTGNLDSANAKSIMALLKEISEDKLVIVVTHNYEDIKEYATRHIRIFDGGVESDEVFQKAENTEYVQDNDDNYERERKFIFEKRSKERRIDGASRKANIRDTFILGWKRFVTRPRQNVFISAILFVAIFGIILAVAYYGNTSFSGRDNSKIMPIEGRVLVAGKDMGYTDEDAQALVDKYGAKSYIRDDFVLDRKVSVLYSKDVMDYENANIKFVDGQKVDKGRLPQSADEVAIRIPYAYANKYVIGNEICVAYDYTLKLVGIDYYIDNRNPMELYLTEEGLGIYAQWTRLNMNGVIYQTGADIPDSTIMRPATIYLDFSITDKTIKTNHQGADGKLFDMYDNNFNMLLEDFTPVYDADIDEKYPYLHGFIYMWIGPQTLKEFYSEYSMQISLIFENDKSAIAAMDKMTDDGYITVLSTKIKEINSKSFANKLLDFISSTLISILISLALSLIVITTLIKLVSVSRNDVAVFRTMGINDKVVKNSTYMQLFLALIPALLLTGVICMILYLAPTGWLLPFMGWDAIMSLLICVAIVLILVAASYNRLIYRNKIKKGLRRANK